MKMKSTHGFPTGLLIAMIIIFQITLEGYAQSDDSPVMILKGHTGSVESVDYSLDGKILVSGSWDNSIKIWDTSTGNCIKSFSDNKIKGISVVFCPDGKKIACRSNDNSIRILDVSSGKNIMAIPTHSTSTSVAYHPGGKHIAGISESGDFAFSIWDISTGNCLKTFYGHSGIIYKVTFSPFGNHIASGSDDNTLKIWDTSTGKCINTFTGHNGSVISIDYSPDDIHIASGSTDETIRIWDQQSGKCTKTLSGHKGKVVSVSFSPNGKYLASGSSDNSIKIWNVSDGHCIKTFYPNSGKINSLSFSPNGKYLASGLSDNTIKIWDISTLQHEGDEIKNYSENIKVVEPIQNIVSAPKACPKLELSNLLFTDKNNNNRIDGDEECEITFTISNSGNGSALNVNAILKNNSKISGIAFDSIIAIGNIEPDTLKQVKIPISGTTSTLSSIATLDISFKEQNGYQPDPIMLQIETKEYLYPMVRITQHKFYTDNGTIKLGSPIKLKCIVQNTNLGLAENINVEFQLPTQNVYPISATTFNISELEPGMTQELMFEFIANKLYSASTIPIQIKITEKHGKFSENANIFAIINANSEVITTSSIENTIKNEELTNITIDSLKSDVDLNIPYNSNKKTYRYAIIIGNEDYQSYQPSLNAKSNVQFAKNDAYAFKLYCENTLGIEKGKIYCLFNATAGMMSQKIDIISSLLAQTPNAELIFYYAGLGLTDESTKYPYIIPVDVNASNLNSAIKLFDIYKRFNQAGAKRITIFIDACFSGVARNDELIANRTKRVAPKVETLYGNMVEFTACSGEQSALTYKDVKHGMFTYFLLKKLQETKGDISYKNLADYLIQNVSIESLRINQKEQVPKVNPGIELQSEWQDWNMK